MLPLLAGLVAWGWAAEVPPSKAPAKRAASFVFGGIGWAEDEPWNTLAYRRSFLVGMTEHDPFLVPPDETGFEAFSQNEPNAAKLYHDVARLYAVDLGVDPGALATNRWKKAVAESLQPFLGNVGAGDLKQELAYLAGVYARWGTPTGFRFTGTKRGYEIAGIIDAHNG